VSDMTVAQVVDSTREHLLGNGRSEMNVIASTSATTNSTTATVVTTLYPLNGITPGSYISVGDEEMYVFATNPGNLTATVSRGENSTTPQNQGSGSRIYVNEPFNRSMIVNAIVDDIRSWGPQVYQVKSVDIPVVPYQRGYDLGAISPYYSVMEVLLSPYPSFSLNDNLDWKRVRFHDFQNAPVSDFPSGNALIVDDAGGMQGGNIPNWNISGVTVSLHVTYAAAFDVDLIASYAETTTMCAQIGLDETDLDIPALGAAWRLMFMREARRATELMQGEPRVESEVPPLYISKTAAQFKILRDSRLADAQYRLLRMYGIRSTP
jgi:hypothetical protein